MILIISGTNRPKSNTRVVADYLYNLLSAESEEEVAFLSLEDLPPEILHNDMYESQKLPQSLIDIQESVILPSQKWIIVSPEYNGSFPGILKLFIDAISIRKYDQNFKGKQVALIGVSSGRAGNLRGMEHLTGLLNYLKMHVHPEKLPVSRIEEMKGDDEELDGLTKTNLNRVMKEYILEPVF